MECPEANIDAKLFLDITTKIFKEKIDVLTRQQAERVAGEFSIYVSALELNAIHLFRYIVPKIDVETTGFSSNIDCDGIAEITVGEADFMVDEVGGHVVTYEN